MKEKIAFFKQICLILTNNMHKLVYFATCFRMIEIKM
jgi:hypothetical protein